ncbi:hypothetical protein QTG54_001672 [Skeletonema marinoi]|uniref:Uncharacterized protein n=1 Tax=Skeletonema marinoi TaxID=267567 RepID=A0AAD8YLH7_9STRA|nr:hypothetical protein QTG54_001672 [Skeletonema marinoi]
MPSCHSGMLKFVLPLSAAFHAVATHKPIIRTHLMSSWDDFSYDDDDELLDSGVDADFKAADENDDPVAKAMAGQALEHLKLWDGEPIDVPVGSQLELSEENVQGVLAACRQEIGTMFGYQAENRGVGITGGVDYVDLDGPTEVSVYPSRGSFEGRFWHQRPTVLTRVGAYLMGRIPEIVDVVVEDEYELTMRLMTQQYWIN